MEDCLHDHDADNILICFYFLPSGDAELAVMKLIKPPGNTVATQQSRSLALNGHMVNVSCLQWNHLWYIEMRWWLAA